MNDNHLADNRLRIGFIPLCDATALIVAVDKGFTAVEGLDVDLIREVSWSNMRDKLNIGLFDAAHLIAPVAIASSLGLGHVKVPIVAPFALGVNGNAITVSPALYASIAAAAEGNLTDPLVTGRALARVVAARKTRGHDRHLDVTEPEARCDRHRCDQMRGIEQTDVELVAHVRPRHLADEIDVEAFRGGEALVDCDD